MKSKTNFLSKTNNKTGETTSEADSREGFGKSKTNLLTPPLMEQIQKMIDEKFELATENFKTIRSPVKLRNQGKSSLTLSRQLNSVQSKGSARSASSPMKVAFEDQVEELQAEEIEERSQASFDSNDDTSEVGTSLPLMAQVQKKLKKYVTDKKLKTTLNESFNKFRQELISACDIKNQEFVRDYTKKVSQKL